MTIKDELLAEYDAAMTDLDRANLHAFMAAREKRTAGRRVAAAESALKQSGITPKRLPAPKKSDQAEAEAA
ncbi:MAG: hypothetical protein JWO67_1500 [Streptosporangiaceae bacterium]|nr:hypothetical protein [Streptosporangiaceae bacterium]